MNQHRRHTTTAHQARELVLDLCERAGSPDDVAAALKRLPMAYDAQQAAVLALTALHIVFSECLSAPVPTARLQVAS